LLHPDLEIDADYHDLSPYPGKRVTYTIRYSNTEHIATAGVVVTATQARYTTYDPMASSDWYSGADGHYTYTVGTMDYNQRGELLFVVTISTETFAETMPPIFDTAFGIFDNGISGEDADPSDNIAPAPLGLPDLVVTGMEVNWDSLRSHQRGVHVTVTIENQGTGLACNTRPPPSGSPNFCASFYIDLYVNPDKPLASFPVSSPLGIAYTKRAGPVFPGESKSYPIISATDGVTAPGFTQAVTELIPLFLYAHVDSYNDPDRPYGLVAEFDETNNVYNHPMGPKGWDFLFLPISVKK